MNIKAGEPWGWKSLVPINFLPIWYQSCEMSILLRGAKLSNLALQLENCSPRTPKLENRRTSQLENRRTSQLENGRTSPWFPCFPCSPCSPCAPNLLHVLPSGMVGWNDFCTPAASLVKPAGTEAQYTADIRTCHTRSDLKENKAVWPNLRQQVLQVKLQNTVTHLQLWLPTSKRYHRTSYAMQQICCGNKDDFEAFFIVTINSSHGKNSSWEAYEQMGWCDIF